MLVALTDDHAYFSLTEHVPKTTLHQLRQSRTFFCPQCKEALILKIGQIKIPHFAHQKNSQCDALFSEGESATHLLGKKQLFSFFQQRQLAVELEPFLHKLRQRPDLLVTKNNRHYAIEFQCSRLTSELYAERTKGYEMHNIVPVWLLQTPSDKYKARGLVKISINHFHQLFLKQSRQTYVITYDTASESFYYVSNLVWFQGQQYIGFAQALPSTKQAFPFYMPQQVNFAQFQQILTRYKRENDGYLRNRLLFTKAGAMDVVLRGLYELKLDRAQLPSFIGIPLQGGEALATPAVAWQIAWFYFLHCHQLTCSMFQKGAIAYFFEWANLPGSKEAERLVERYVAILARSTIEHVGSTVQTVQFAHDLYDEFVAID